MSEVNQDANSADTNQEAASKEVATENLLYTETENEGDKTQPLPNENAQEEKPPIEYDIKLPEGNQLFNDSDKERIVSFAKEHGLSNDAAQKLLDSEADKLRAIQENYVRSQEAQAQEWQNMLKDDKDFGGENFEGNVKLARSVIQKFGSDELKTALNKSGFANFPPLVKMIAKIGKQMENDTLVTSGTSVGNSGNKKSIEEIFYGTTN